MVFDIGADHKFVRRISIPSFREGLRGFTPSAANHCAYYSTTSRRLGCVAALAAPLGVVTFRRVPSDCHNVVVHQATVELGIDGTSWPAGKEERPRDVLPLARGG